MTARRNLAGKSAGRAALLRRLRIAGLYGLLVGLAALSAQAYVRILTSSGNPLRRTDQSNIQFLIHDQVAAGLTNADGELWITAGSDPRAALRAALDNWDRVADADLLFAAPTETSVAHVPDDGNHVFVFDDTPEIRSALGPALAIARSRFFVSGEIIDSDILFNPRPMINGQQVPFSTTLQEGTFDLEGVATHELGHALGANHTHILAASMFPRTPPSSRLQADVTGDDIAFAVEAYPASGAQAARGSISGTVTLTGGGPAGGVLLTAVDPNGGITVGTLSDFNDGTYEFGPLPPGGYQVTAEPASGTVTPGDFPPADPGGASFNTNVLSDFLGGASTPQTVQVLAGLDARARRPGAATMRLLTQSAFDEDDRTFFFAGFFLMAGQVLRCQPRILRCAPALCRRAVAGSNRAPAGSSRHGPRDSARRTRLRSDERPADSSTAASGSRAPRGLPAATPRGVRAARRPTAAYGRRGRPGATRLRRHAGIVAATR